MSQPMSVLYPQILPKVPDAPIPMVQDAIRRAARRFCNESCWVKRTIGNPNTTTPLLVCTPDVNFLQLVDGSDEEIVMIKDVQIFSITAQRWLPMNPVQPDSIDPNMTPTLPRQWAFIPYTAIQFDNTPDMAYPIQATVIIQPNNETVNLPDECLRKYDRVIANGALEILMNLPEQPFTDKAMAALLGRSFNSGIGNGKVDAIRSASMGTTRVRPKRFIV